eukprot:COSAG06_NODE_664_length_13285_cov_14.962853_11_plen_55_part_00
MSLSSRGAAGAPPAPRMELARLYSFCSFLPPSQRSSIEPAQDLTLRDLRSLLDH